MKLPFLPPLLPLLLCCAACAHESRPAASPAAEPKPVQAPREPPPYDAKLGWPSAVCRLRAESLLAKLTLKEKIAQMVQPDQKVLTAPGDLATLGLGALLSGGGSVPAEDAAAAWAIMVDGYQAQVRVSRMKIPLLYGVDAVHGHSNVPGATIFPHNIGLGATRDPDLVRRIARATAEEVAATNIDWTFAPVLAAARDERWGRTYEAFGETGELAALLGPAAIVGYQGEVPGKADPAILATAKHFVGDGGTTGGVDRGNTETDDRLLWKHHLRQYQAAIDAGALSVMASFSSVNGTPMHQHQELLTGMLKKTLRFQGFVVSDWNAVELLPGDYPTQVTSAVNSGVDMFMGSGPYVRFIDTLAGLVPTEVPEWRIDDAVRRILAVKCEFGVLDWRPRSREWAGSVGSAQHRKLAREAVQRSLVLLKNEGQLLPLNPALSRIHVSGKSANDIGNQCGGWTISWQGSSGETTQGTTILQGIRELVGDASRVTFSQDGSGAEGADLAIAVVGEVPYAEMGGDTTEPKLDQVDQALIDRLDGTGIPVVTVLISGRPLVLGAALERSDALVAAWLPGSEGAGVADVLFGIAPMSGKLGHSWPRTKEQIPINVGDAKYDPLFPYGFGLTYPGRSREPPSCLGR